MSSETQPEHEAAVLPFRKPHREEIAGQVVNLAVMSVVELELLEAQLQDVKDTADTELFIVRWELSCREQPTLDGGAS